MLYTFLVYSFKVAAILSILLVFYYVLLSGLTFYKTNRFCLLLFGVSALIIPSINSPQFLVFDTFFTRQTDLAPVVINLQVHQSPYAISSLSDKYPLWQLIALIVMLTGMLIVATLQYIGYLSYRQLKKTATLAKTGKVTIYNLSRKAAPFSFGKNIFIHFPSHTSNEVSEIIQHETAHASQRHSYDILLAQLLTIFQWWNPFIWLFQNAVRQNLEFLADESVLQKGNNVRAYQYHLLKISGNAVPSFANAFSISSLKTRIIMMNKQPTPWIQALRFVLLVPAFAVLVAACGNQNKNDIPSQTKATTDEATATKDTTVANKPTPANSKVDSVPLKPTPPVPEKKPVIRFTPPKIVKDNEVAPPPPPPSKPLPPPPPKMLKGKIVKSLTPPKIVKDEEAVIDSTKAE